MLTVSLIMSEVTTDSPAASARHRRGQTARPTPPSPQGVVREGTSTRAFRSTRKGQVGCHWMIGGGARGSRYLPFQQTKLHFPHFSPCLQNGLAIVFFFHVLAGSVSVASAACLGWQHHPPRLCNTMLLDVGHPPRGGCAWHGRAAGCGWVVLFHANGEKRLVGFACLPSKCQPIPASMTLHHSLTLWPRLCTPRC